jgi:hypothetical protein
VPPPLIADCLANVECRAVDVNRYGLFVLDGLKAWVDPQREKAKTVHHKATANSSSMARRSDCRRGRRDGERIDMPKLLIGAGMVLILVGLARLVGERFGLGRLPGDRVVERGDFRLYIPITTSLIVSVALSVAFWLFNR